MMDKRLRQQVYDKYGGLCAYSGKPLDDSWQVDHLIPKHIVLRFLPERNPDDISNLMPALKIVNHYKRGLSVEQFRTWYLGGLHTRLKTLPKNPYSPTTIRRKKYLLEVARIFNITEDKPFNGIFYFETYESRSRD